MKEQIERKIGCTIEEYYHKMQEFWMNKPNTEVDCENPLTAFSDEELDFMDEYIHKVFG